MSMDYNPVAEGGILSQSFTISKGSDKKAQSSAGQSMKEDQTLPPENNPHAKNASCAEISVPHVFPFARHHWIMSEQISRSTQQRWPNTGRHFPSLGQLVLLSCS